MTVTAAHGFPKTISSVEDIIVIARDIGQALLLKQADVVAVQRKQVSATADIWVDTKPDGSSVTSSDIWANIEIEKRLKALPFDQSSIGFITEEGDKNTNKRAAKKKAAWVIDPLDNTGDYKRGNNDWSVTIGFHENGLPTGGVVYYPARGELYFTNDNGKACAIDEKERMMFTLSGRSAQTKDVRVVTDFNVKAQVAKNVVETHATHTHRYWNIAVEHGADIAEHGDLFYSWDIVAPAAIAARANVVYLKRDGSPLNFLVAESGNNDFEMPRDGFVAGNRDTLKNIGFMKPESTPAFMTARKQRPEIS